MKFKENAKKGLSLHVLSRYVKYSFHQNYITVQKHFWVSSNHPNKFLPREIQNNNISFQIPMQKHNFLASEITSRGCFFSFFGRIVIAFIWRHTSFIPTVADRFLYPWDAFSYHSVFHLTNKKKRKRRKRIFHSNVDGKSKSYLWMPHLNFDVVPFSNVASCEKQIGY